MLDFSEQKAVIKSVNDLKLNASNPRFIKDENFNKLKKSLKEFPKMLEYRPIIVDENFVVLGGNMRLRAAIELGYKNVPALLVTDLTEEQKKELIIKDNVGFGEWDFDMLANEWETEKLSDWGLELPLSFSEKEIEIDDDDFEIPNEIQTDIVVGDLFEIGEHRLLCGDAIDSDAVEKLMNNNKANFVFTDPPYDLPNEDYHNNLFLFTKDAHIFLMHDDKGIVNYLRKSKLEFVRFYIADFVFSSPRGNDPYLKHILISQEKNGKAIPHKNLYDGFSSIIKMEYRGTLKDEQTQHKHQKPIKFIRTFIEHYSNENDIVLDLFAGSGTTFIAAEQVNRKCYATELEPKYCQLIIDRILNLYPQMKIKRNGLEYKRTVE